MKIISNFKSYFKLTEKSSKKGIRLYLQRFAQKWFKDKRVRFVGACIIVGYCK
jgi:hypothetical protein